MSSQLPYIKEFETIILKDNQKEAMKSVIPGSIHELFLYFNEEYNKCIAEKTITKRMGEIMKDLSTRKEYTTLHKECILRKVLAEYDFSSTTPERKKEIIDHLHREYCNTKFDFPKPNIATTIASSTSESLKIPSVLTQDIIDNVIKEKRKQCNPNNDLIVDFAETKDLKKYQLIDNLEVFPQSLTRLLDYYFPSYLLSEKATKAFAKCLQESKENNTYRLQYNNLTLRQLEIFDEMTDEFCIDKNQLYHEIINKKYEPRLTAYQGNDQKQREVLIEIYNFVKSKNKCRDYCSSILFLILEKGIDTNNYDLSLFKDFIKNPLQTSHISSFNNSNQIMKKSYNVGNINADANQTSEIISAYLQYFFMNNLATIKDFEDVFTINHLKTEETKAKILKGETIPRDSCVLSKSTYDDLCKKVEITLCKHNQTSFAIDEDVAIDIALKNVPVLFVKIFEINTENYYLVNKKPITSLINIEGLLTKMEDTYSFNESPQKMIKHRFVFDKIPKRRGVYIIELLGNGISSRIIIKKGNLSVISRSIAKGKLCYILDEKHEICKENAAMWFRGNKYTCDKDTGSILIPYQSKPSNDSLAILLNGPFAEISDLNVPDEKYELKGKFIINHETIMTGNVSKVIFKPLLLINQKETLLSYMKKCKITVMIEKEENNRTIPIVTNIDDIPQINDIDTLKQIEFDIQIPSKMTSLQFSFDCEIFNSSKRKMEKYNRMEHFSIDRNITSQMNHFFLRKTKENCYVVSLLGKNGEVADNEMVDLKCFYCDSNNALELPMQTNDKGEIELGKLMQFQSIRLSAMNNSITADFTLDNSEKFSYPGLIDTIKEQSITLPYQGNEANIKLVKVNDFTQNNVIGIIKLTKNNSSLEKLHTPAGDDYQLTIKGLDIGTYNLYLNYQQIRIEVHDGKYWVDGRNFIITNKKLVENSSYQTPIFINELKLEEKTIKFKVNTLSKNSIANVYLFQYLPDSIHYDAYMIKYILQNTEMTNEQSYQQWKNIYLSNRTINEEIQYVLDRKNYEQFMGNSLEMPSLLLKRQFTKDSSIDKETINKGTKYEKKDADNVSKVYEKYFCSGNNEDSQGSFIISDFQNFIHQIPYVQLALTADKESGEFIVNLPSNINHWGHCHIICFDDKSVCSEMFPIDNAMNVQKRKIALSKALNNEKNYTEIRKTELVKKDQKITISELSNYKIIDSITKTVEYILVKRPHFKKKWNEISFLITKEKNEEELFKHLSQYISHEVNVFMYFKYPDLFTKYIKPILKYKFEKTFIDYVLLDDKESVKRFLTVGSVMKLNLFELCLMIMSIGKELPDEAKKIRNIIKQRVQMENIQAVLTSNFDIMINMKLGGDSDLEKVALKERMIMECKYEEDCVMECCENECYMDAGIDRFCYDEEESRDACVSYASNIMNCMPQYQQQQSQMAPRMMQQACFMAMPQSNCMQPQEQMLRCQPDVFNEKRYEEYGRREESKAVEYDKPSGPKEYKERHYLHAEHKTKQSSPFWLDFADHLINTASPVNFLSKYLLINEVSFSEMMWIISVLDLPINSTNHIIKRVEERNIEITPSSNLMLFTKKLSEATVDINKNLFISQNVTNTVNQESIDNGTYKKNTIYTHETIVTNISNKLIDFELFIQIPEGAIPMYSSDYTQTHHMSLNSYITTSHVVYFYFPEEGVFVQYHPVATVDNDIISIGTPLTYKVQSVKSYQVSSNDEHKLEAIISNGDKKDILAYFKKELMKNEDLPLILWLLKDKAFYLELIGILRGWGVFFNEVWSFGFYHNDESAIREFLNTKNQIKETLGNQYESSLVKINRNNNFDLMNHLEYSPFFNARVHLLGKSTSGILNKEFKETYEKFIISLLHITPLDMKHLLQLTYYLILQDRIEEAVTVFERIKVDKDKEGQCESFMIQYDYINAYLDFSIGYPKFSIARANCTKYKKFPLMFWRELFEEIEDQLIEYDGKEKISAFATAENDAMEINKKKMKKELQASVPKLTFNIENKQLKICHANINEVTIKFYQIDLEILFSRNPFISSNSNDFSFVQPNYTTKLAVDNLTKGADVVTSFDIPKDFISKNIFIEVSSESKKAFDTYFSADVQVFISENLGELKVCDGKNIPLRKAYVKCFSKMRNGTVKFYKDGYTDLRGLFNYLELNTNQIREIDSFSIFICHDENGSLIKQCRPPYNIDPPANGQDDMAVFQNYKQKQRSNWRTLNK